MRIRLLIYTTILGLSLAKQPIVDSNPALNKSLNSSQSSVVSNLLRLQHHSPHVEFNMSNISGRKMSKDTDLPLTISAQSSSKTTAVPQSLSLSHIFKTTDSLVTPTNLPKKQQRNLASKDVVTEFNDVSLGDRQPVSDREELKTVDDSNAKDTDLGGEKKTEEISKTTTTTISSTNSSASTSASTSTKKTKPPKPKKKHTVGHYIGIAFLILFLLGIIGAAGYYIYLRIKQRQLEYDMTMNPESVLLQKVELSAAAKDLYMKWTFEPATEDVHLERETAVVGEYLKLRFNQSKGHFRTVFGNQDLKVQANDYVYFEIEIEDLLDSDTSITIGLVDHKTLEVDKHPGMLHNGVSFNAKNGIVMKSGKVMYNYDINANYGEILGLGYRFSDSRVWLFYNAKRELHQYETDLKDANSKVIKLEKDKAYRMAVSADGPCEVIVNLGGAPFRAQNKEIAKGVL